MEEVENLKGFSRLRVVNFEKKNGTNIICIKNKMEYYRLIKKCVIDCVANVNILKIDDKSASQIISHLNRMLAEAEHDNSSSINNGSFNIPT